ncbi:MAG TPA: hypothetical protein VGH53_27355 [Streptosporangiaceae bacterium]|jgi:hypothetical protein
MTRPASTPAAEATAGEPAVVLEAGPATGSYDRTVKKLAKQLGLPR